MINGLRFTVVGLRLSKTDYQRKAVQPIELTSCHLLDIEPKWREMSRFKLVAVNREP